jgi:hypothetical protein
MRLLTSILLVLAGLVGAAPMVVTRFPGLKNTIDSVRKYSSSIGIFLLISGLIRVLRIIGGRSVDIGDIALIIAMVGLGFLQGFEFVMGLFRNNQNLMNKTANLRHKLIKYQEGLGVLALIVGFLYFFKFI